MMWESVLSEWLSLILRWLHVVAAIGWIGSSFYFIHLDLSLKPRENLPEGAYGDADITDHVPSGRFATPDDVAQAVAFLADSSRSGFVNGAALSVDGGWHSDGSWQSLRLGARSR